MNVRRKNGFTLLELLLVVAALAILAVIVILVINPAETLKKSRDAQRLSDLASLKTAIAFYTTNTTSPMLGGSSNSSCKTGSGGGSYSSGSKIYYSLPAESDIDDTTLDGGGSNIPIASQVTSSSIGIADGTGWIPVNLNALIEGSPISNLPVDPVNHVASLTSVAATDLVYRYACNATNLTFEIDATLESQAYTTGDNKLVKDGGNNQYLYETGTNLLILGSGADF